MPKAKHLVYALKTTEDTPRYYVGLTAHELRQRLIDLWTKWHSLSHA